jgi:aldehyde:ferredoxin oxidoreductase
LVDQHSGLGPGSGRTPDVGPPGAPPPMKEKPPFPMGYNGKMLRVNLTQKTIVTETLSEELCRQYLGGAGFIAYFLWKELKPGIDPLGPENKLVFALGPITGMVLPGAARNSIGAKSPLSKGIAKAESGGFWMAELKRAGYDGIIVEGKAEKPVYLWVHDGEASIRDACHLWGKETRETEAAIRAELGDEHIHVAMIGPGGENMVRFACIMQGCHDAAGRGGLGAVMGSKNLKAIAARGHTLPPIVDPEKFKEIRQELTRPHPISMFGTGGPEMVHGEAAGDLPVRNFRDGAFPEVAQIHGGVIKDTIRVGMEGCFACPVRCKKVVKAEAPYKIEPAYGGPEYEALASLGSNCGVGDVKAVCKGNERCNAYSLDSISTGAVISFAMECYEKGLLSQKDTGGLELKFGNAEAMLKAIDLIAKREGIGNFLAEGTARMAQKIGKGSEVFAMNTKGLEFGMHEPRMGSLLAMCYLVSPTGADHCHVEPDPQMSNPLIFSQFHPVGWTKPPQPNELGMRKVGIFRTIEFYNILKDSLTVCNFPAPNIEQIVELLKATVGWDTGISELLMIGERIITTMRLFNFREGLTEADDALPERFYGPTTDGALVNLKPDPKSYERMRKYYYTLMGWDSRGLPLPEKVEELDIDRSPNYQ